MHRFFVDSADICEDSLKIKGEEANHIKNVLRMQPGDAFTAFDGAGSDYMCRITDVGADVKAQITARVRNMCEPDIAVTLYQAYPKAAKMEEIVQKAVELGVKAIVPFLSARCVKRPKDVSRLRRVVLAAVKQCGRSLLPPVSDIKSFEDATFQMKNHEALIVCWEEEKHTALKTALAGQARDIGIVIGSEGGFTRGEVEAMQQAGGVSVTLGPRIMRTETAGIAVLAAVMYDKGQM